MDIPLSRPEVTAGDRAAVMDVLNSPHLSLGPKLAEFEHAISHIAGTAHAVAVNSGTSGLHLAVKAAGIKAGDEVITTPFSFVASANCVLYEAATPVFVDIDENSLNIDPLLIERAVTNRTTAILPVHVFGRPCRMSEILRIAERHGLAVVEDACEAIGARYKGQPVGGLGQAGVFAFYPNKQVTTGEGGAIVTNRDDIASDCRSWRNQGRKDGCAWLEHDSLGFNYRLSDLQCALGISQVRRLDRIMAARARVSSLYNQALAGLSQLVLPAPPEAGTQISWFVYVVRLAAEFTVEHRDTVIQQLRLRGIGCNDYFRPIHLQPFYRARFGYRKGDYPVTESVAERTIALPFFNNLSESDIGCVCDTLRNILSSMKVRRPSKAVAVAVAKAV